MDVTEKVKKEGAEASERDEEEEEGGEAKTSPAGNSGVPQWLHMFSYFLSLHVAQQLIIFKVKISKALKLASPSNRFCLVNGYRDILRYLLTQKSAK